MKRLLLVGVLVGMATTGRAWYENNPDHLPSIGFSYTGQALTGDASVTSGGLTAKQDVDSVSGVLAADTRIPISDNITIHGTLGIVGAEATAEETPLLDAGKSDLGGVLFSVGVRFYLGGSRHQEKPKVPRSAYPRSQGDDNAFIEDDPPSRNSVNPAEKLTYDELMEELQRRRTR